jgi:hypothetical protein
MAFYALLLGCSTGSRDSSTAVDNAPECVEDPADQTFLGNANELRTSDGFRQNVWLSSNGPLGAICMDLHHQLYLVVVTDFPTYPPEHLSERFRSLQISAPTLRERMHRDSFILDGAGIDWIYRIPPDAEESFVAHLFNELCGLNLKPNNIWFGWD